MQLPSREVLNSASAVVRQLMPATPTIRWPLLEQRLGAEVWVKHENHSPIGAFKLRTAAVYLDWLRREHSEVKGVIAATKGNFGQGIAAAAAHFGLRATIVVPLANSREKNRAMRAWGADLLEHGEDFQAALEYAAELALSRALHMAPSFHPLLVQGAGTIGLEMFASAPELETVYLPIGLGSSICGTMAAKAALQLKTSIVGVVAAASPTYAHSFREGRVMAHPTETKIADGIACRLPDAEALEVILRGVDRIVEVTDAEIARAMRVFYEDTHNIAEGAGAVALAGLMQEQERQHGKRVGVVLTGGNVDREVFIEALTGDLRDQTIYGAPPPTK